MDTRQCPIRQRTSLQGMYFTLASQPWVMEAPFNSHSSFSPRPPRTTSSSSSIFYLSWHQTHAIGKQANPSLRLEHRRIGSYLFTIFSSHGCMRNSVGEHLPHKSETLVSTASTTICLSILLSFHKMRGY
jgi:hypothetical protein